MLNWTLINSTIIFSFVMLNVIFGANVTWITERLVYPANLNLHTSLTFAYLRQWSMQISLKQKIVNLHFLEPGILLLKSTNLRLSYFCHQKQINKHQNYMKKHIYIVRSIRPMLTRRWAKDYKSSDIMRITIILESHTHTQTPISQAPSSTLCCGLNFELFSRFHFKA